MSNWVDISLAAGALTTVVGGVGGLVVRHFVRTLGHSMQAKVDAAKQEIVAHVDTRLDTNDAVTNQTREDVVKIRATVFPNGGSSLADRVGRIEVNVAEMRGEWKQSQKEGRR